VTLAKILPNTPRDIILFIHNFLVLIITGENFITPKPPIFSITPAKIIDPSTGASTCAFGNHMWTKKAGNLAKKIKIKNNQSLLRF